MERIVIMFIAIATVMTLTACADATKKQFAEVSDDILIKKDNSFTGNVRDLLSMGKKQKCTWNEAGEVMGVVYTDGDKVRTESNVFMLNESVESRRMIVIDDGEWTWTWYEGDEEGVKINDVNMPIAEEMEGIDIIDDSKDITQEEIYDYKCTDWMENSRTFMPPVDIKFVDMQQMVNNMKNATTVGLDAMCDDALESEKNKCLNALNDVENVTSLVQ